MLPQAPVYRRNVHFFTYKGYASCPNTAQMNTPGLLRSPEETYRASVLVARLGTLLSCPIEVDWAAVLATATALKAILLRDPEAKDLCTYIDENVMYRCFTALKRPGDAADVLEEALSRRPVLPRADPLGQAVALETPEPAVRAEMQQQLDVRKLQHRCYQQCIADATAAAAAVVAAAVQEQQQQNQWSISQQPLQHQHQQQHGATDQPTLQATTEAIIQRHRSAAILNCQHILQLATSLQDQQQQAAAAAADLADLHTAAGSTAVARDLYMQCLQICRAAVTQHAAAAEGGRLWVQEVLPAFVPSAIDIYIQLGDPDGARACLLIYNNIQLALGRSACGECAVCYDIMTGETPVTLLGCGHLFHRSCCNEWFGTKMFDCGRFQPECPLCRQIDEAVRPSQAALEELEELQQYANQAGQNDTTSSSEDSVGSSSTDSSSVRDSADSDAESGGEVGSEVVTQSLADPRVEGATGDGA